MLVSDLLLWNVEGGGFGYSAFARGGVVMGLGGYWSWTSELEYGGWLFETFLHQGTVRV